MPRLIPSCIVSSSLVFSHPRLVSSGVVVPHLILVSSYLLSPFLFPSPHPTRAHLDLSHLIKWSCLISFHLIMSHPASSCSASAHPTSSCLALSHVVLLFHVVTCIRDDLGWFTKCCCSISRCNLILFIYFLLRYHVCELETMNRSVWNVALTIWMESLMLTLFLVFFCQVYFFTVYDIRCRFIHHLYCMRVYYNHGEVESDAIGVTA